MAKKKSKKTKKTPKLDVDSMKDFISDIFGSMGVDRVSFCDEKGKESCGFDIKKPKKIK